MHKKKGEEDGDEGEGEIVLDERLERVSYRKGGEQRKGKRSRWGEGRAQQRECMREREREKEE